MKNLIVVMATCLLWSVAAKADYNGYHIQFTIEYKNGKSNTGYAYVAAGYFNTDSLKSTSYLLTALDQNAKGISENDSLVYFKHRLKYNFQIPGDTTNEKFHIYYLTGLSSVAFKAVKALTIDTLIDFGYGTTIASALSIADLSWMKTKPKASYVFGGYLC